MDYIASRIRQDRIQNEIERLPQAFHRATVALQPFTQADLQNASPTRDYIQDDLSRFEPFLHDLKDISAKLRDASGPSTPRDKEIPKAEKLDRRLKQQCDTIVDEFSELLEPLKELGRKHDAADTRVRVMKSVLRQVEEVSREVERRIGDREEMEREVEDGAKDLADPQTKPSPSPSLLGQPRRSVSIGSEDSQSVTSVHTPARRISRPARSPTHPYGPAIGSQGIGATPRLRFVTQLSSFQNAGFFLGSPVAVARNANIRGIPRSPR